MTFQACQVLTVSDSTGSVPVMADELAPPAARPAVVTVGMLADALGVDPQRLRRWANRGRIAAPQQPHPRAHRRWTVPEAAAILRAYGRAIPEAWGA